jgi:hypothetical protein
MEQLPERFPAKKVSSATLHEIASRARRQFANGAASPDAPVPATRSPLVVAARKWMSGLNIGLLDLAALAALVFLSISLIGMYLNSHTRALREAHRVAETKRHTYSPAGDGKDDAKDVLPPAPAPAPEPNPEPESKAHQPVPSALDTAKTDAAVLQDEVIPADLPVPDTRGLPGQLEHDPNRGGREFGAADPAGKSVFTDSAGAGSRKLTVLRNGGSRAVIDTTGLAVQWLAYHQEADGHWGATKYGAGCKVDTALTALAVLAFVRSGYTAEVGMYRENVKRALDWLLSKQHKDGLIFDETDAGAHRGIGYPGGIAALALCEAASQSRNAQIKEAAALAIKYAALHQQGEGNERLGWRYAAKSSGDICVSGWWIQALAAAKRAGIAVDPDVFNGASHFLDNVQLKRANGSVQYTYLPKTEPNKRRDAIGVYCRLLLGGDSTAQQASVEAFVNSGGVPAWGLNGEQVDLYYWYYGTYCTFVQNSEMWSRWSVGLKKALIENQCKQGDDAGSWPVVGDFSNEWGRVGQTAMSCLCLDAYYLDARRRGPPISAKDASLAVTTAAGNGAPAAEAELLGKLRTKVSFNIIDKSLPDAVALLSQLTELKVELAPAAAKGQGSISLRVTEMSFDLAIDWVARLADCEKRVENGRIIIDIKNPAPVAPRAAEEKPMEKRDEF